MVDTVREHGTFDKLLELKDAGAVTASAAAQVGGSAKIIDLGTGTQPAGQAQTYGRVIIDVSAIDIVTGDEGYDIVLQGSPDATFGTAGNIVELVGLHVGAKGTKRTDSDKDDTVGRYTLPFTNARDGVYYRYVRLYHAIVGTTPSINYKAYMAPGLV